MGRSSSQEVSSRCDPGSAAWRVVVARNCPNSPAALDVLVVRKIGHPHFREFAVGALAEAKPWFWISSPLIEPASGQMNSMDHRRRNHPIERLR